MLLTERSIDNRTIRSIWLAILRAFFNVYFSREIDENRQFKLSSKMMFIVRYQSGYV